MGKHAVGNVTTWETQMTMSYSAIVQVAAKTQSNLTSRKAKRFARVLRREERSSDMRLRR